MIAILVLTTISLAGFGAQRARQETVEMPKADPLDAEISIRDGFLVIRYHVRNAGKVPVFLTDKILRADADAPLGADNVYAQILDDGGLEISKQVAAIPSGKSPVNLVTPYMKRLDPGAQLDDEIVLALPLRPYREYVDNTPIVDEDSAPLIIKTQSVEFVLGYFLPPEGAQITRGLAFDVPVDNFVNPKGQRANYGLMRSKRFRIDVPVIRTKATK